MRFRREKKEEKPIVAPVKAVAPEAAKETVEATTSVLVLETWPQKRVVLRVIIIILLVAALMWVLYKLQGVILVVVLSIFFAYLVAPLVEFVHRPFKLRGRKRLMPRVLAIGIVYLAIFGSIGLTIFLLAPKLGEQFTKFAAQAPELIDRMQRRAGGLGDFCARYNIPVKACETINSTLKGAIDSANKYAKEELPSVVGASIVQILGYIPWLILIPILSFFFLKDVESFRRSALQMLPSGRWRWRGDEFFQDVNSTLAAYIRAQLTACLFIGTVCTLGFIIIGVPFSLVLGVLAGLLEFIPLVGPLVVGVIAVLVTSFSPDTSTYAALWVVLFLFTLRVVNDYTIYPRIIGQGIHLHPLAVIMAILCGAELAGVAGIFLAIPVIAITTVSYRHWLEHRGSEGLMADILQPEEEVDTNLDHLEGVTTIGVSHQNPNDHSHPTSETTPEEMVRARPDLTTGELKLPKMD